MLDYEILSYIVEYFIDGATSPSKRRFYQEEEAIKYIKEHRDRWKSYKLVQRQAAIIDF